MGTITQNCNRLIIDYIGEFIIINRLHLFLSSNRLLYNSIHERNTCIFIDKFTWKLEFYIISAQSNVCNLKISVIAEWES